jgi:hypothetical protein
MTPETHPVTLAVDRYLNHYKNSPQATKEAHAALSYFQHMVDLATSRTVEWLAVPDNNVVVVDFSRPKPDDPHLDTPA